VNTRRSLLKLTALAGLVAPALRSPAHAQAADFPTRPIRWIVPYLPGTAPDMIARALTDTLTEILKQPVVIENKAGAAGNIGAQQAARAPADGHTWVYSATTMAINMRMYKAPGFDVMKDFAHAARIGTSDVLLVVSPDSGIRSLSALIARMRQEPGKLNFGSGGVGTPAHLGAELILSTAGVSAVHVPFKGAVESVNAILGGQIDFTIGVLGAAVPHIRAGRLRALGLTTSKRSSALPQVPTIAEAGLPGYEVSPWFAVFMPAATPKPIVARVNAALLEAMKQPDIRAKFETIGAEPIGSSPDELASHLNREIVRWGKLITERNIKSD